MLSGRPVRYRGVSHVVSGRTLLFLALTFTAAEDFIQLFSRSGEAVMLDLNMSEVEEPRWKHAGKLLTSKRMLNGEQSSRFKLFPNGSLLLFSGRKTDSGNYTGEVFSNNGFRKLTMTYGLHILDDPEVRARCALDGSLVLTCSVQSEDNVYLRWVGPNAPTNQRMTPRSKLTLYLPSMKEDITCEVESKLRSSLLPVDCRGRVALIVVVVGFTLSFLTLVLLQLRTTCNRAPLTAGEDSLYMDMRADQKPTQMTSVRPESCYILMKTGVLPQRGIANTSGNVSCGSGPAAPEEPARTQRTSSGEGPQENIYC